MIYAFPQHKTKSKRLINNKEIQRAPKPFGNSNINSHSGSNNQTGAPFPPSPSIEQQQQSSQTFTQNQTTSNNTSSEYLNNSHNFSDFLPLNRDSQFSSSTSETLSRTNLLTSGENTLEFSPTKGHTSSVLGGVFRKPLHLSPKRSEVFNQLITKKLNKHSSSSSGSSDTLDLSTLDSPTDNLSPDNFEGLIEIICESCRSNENTADYDSTMFTDPNKATTAKSIPFQTQNSPVVNYGAAPSPFIQPSLTAEQIRNNQQHLVRLQLYSNGYILPPQVSSQQLLNSNEISTYQTGSQVSLMTTSAICSVCKKLYPLTEYRCHKKDCERKKTFPCIHCKKPFNYSCRLREHIKSCKFKSKASSNLVFVTNNHDLTEEHAENGSLSSSSSRPTTLKQILPRQSFPVLPSYQPRIFDTSTQTSTSFSTPYQTQFTLHNINTPQTIKVNGFHTSNTSETHADYSLHNGVTNSNGNHAAVFTAPSSPLQSGNNSPILIRTPSPVIHTAHRSPKVGLQKVSVNLKNYGKPYTANKSPSSRASSVDYNSGDEDMFNYSDNDSQHEGYAASVEADDNESLYTTQSPCFSLVSNNSYFGLENTFDLTPPRDDDFDEYEIMDGIPSPLSSPGRLSSQSEFEPESIVPSDASLTNLLQGLTKTKEVVGSNRKPVDLTLCSSSDSDNDSEVSRLTKVLVNGKHADKELWECANVGCGLKFDNQKAYLQHRERLEVITCTLCNLNFEIKILYEQHMMRKHGRVVENVVTKSLSCIATQKKQYYETIRATSSDGDSS